MVYMGNGSPPLYIYMDREIPLPHMHHQNVFLLIYGPRNVSKSITDYKVSPISHMGHKMPFTQIMIANQSF